MAVSRFEACPGPRLPVAVLFLAALGRTVDQRYVTGRPDAEELDAALEEELDRLEARLLELLEDFDPLEEREPDELYLLADQASLEALLHFD